MSTFLMNPDFLFKIVLVGNSGAGKSSLLRSVSEEQWNGSAFLPTIGVDFKIQTFYVDEKSVKLQIWDTAGQERFKSICRSYYKGSHGVIFVYDVTDRQSFQDIENWVEDVDRIAGKGMNKILIGNKCDVGSERKVSYDEGKQLAEDLGMKFVETSAKIDYGVVEAFTSLAKDMKEKTEKERREDKKVNPAFELKPQPEEKKFKSFIAMFCSWLSFEFNLSN